MANGVERHLLLDRPDVYLQPPREPDVHGACVTLVLHGASPIHSPSSASLTRYYVFQHYGPNTYNKNFIYRGDNWLWATRWEMLIQNRASVSLVEVATWNDYGESHYVGPIEGAQPNSQAWVNGNNHTGPHSPSSHIEVENLHLL